MSELNHTCLPSSDQELLDPSRPEEYDATRQRGVNSRRTLRCVAAIAWLATVSTVQAQSPPNPGLSFPLDQRTPPGVVAEWMARAGRVVPGYFQPIRFSFPSEGRVSIYAGPTAAEVDLPSPAQVGLAVGQIYRLKISHMPEYPGVELYPSVEVVDHLHPPVGQRGNFPVLMEFTPEEMELAMDGGLVTRVVYLEQPQFARPIVQTTPMPVLTIDNSANLLEQADRQGRPMLIVRMGSRMPPSQGGDRAFFGSGAPIEAAAAPEGETGSILQTAATQSIEDAIVRTPAEPRDSIPPHPNRPVLAQPTLADLFPDEYLHDGGDREHPIHYSPVGIEGLNTEDTFAQYYDRHGNRHTLPTNRVAIYAPRFGAVRAVSHVATGTDIQHLADAWKSRRVIGARNRLLASNYHHRSTGVALRMRSRASGVESETRRVTVFQALQPAVHDKLINLYQSYRFLQTGFLEQKDVAHVSAAMQAAHAWTREQNPVIAGHLESLGEVYSSFRIEQVVGTEFEGEEGRLRVAKLADRRAAAPGDLITFAIRFDNLGDRPLTGVTIVDNLTPRLEYVEDSATSDRAGDITVEDNNEGSVVLTFKLDEPLAGKSGGVIEFQVRVR